MPTNKHWIVNILYLVAGVFIGSAATFWAIGPHTYDNIYVISNREHLVPKAFRPRGDLTTSWVLIWACIVNPNPDNVCPQNKKRSVLVTSKKNHPHVGRVYDDYDFQLSHISESSLDIKTRENLSRIAEDWSNNG